MLRIKPLLLIFSILLLLDIVVFGLTESGAWYVDSASSGMTIITAGSLDLRVTTMEESPSNISPGGDFSPIGTFCNHNNGSTDLKFRGIFESGSSFDHEMLSFITMKVERRVPEEWAEEKLIQGSPKEEKDALERYFLFPNQNPKHEPRYIVEGVLRPGEETCYRLSAKIEDKVPKKFQQLSLDFFLHQYATQTTNPGW